MNASAEANAAVAERPLSTSMVICCYNEQRWDDLCVAISSALAQGTALLEIIVVVDHNPELKGRIEARFPTTAVVENRHERGLSGARNTGLANSTGSLIAFLDDDAVADPTMIAVLQKNMEDGACWARSRTSHRCGAHGRNDGFRPNFFGFSAAHISA